MGKGSKRRNENFKKVQKHWDEINWSDKPLSNMPQTHKQSPFDESWYHYDFKDEYVRVKNGATETLSAIGWGAHVYKNYDGRVGKIKYEFGRNTEYHHFCLIFDEKIEVAFPVDLVRFI